MLSKRAIQAVGVVSEESMSFSYVIDFCRRNYQFIVIKGIGALRHDPCEGT